MKLLVNGVLYDSTKVPVLVLFDENEQKMFNGMKRYVSAPEGTTEAEKEALLVYNSDMVHCKGADMDGDVIPKCPHDRVSTWNHGYHNRCNDCGEEDV